MALFKMGTVFVMDGLKIHYMKFRCTVTNVTVYNIVIIRTAPSEVALLIKIIGHLTNITDLPVADAPTRKANSFLTPLPCSILTVATEFTMLPKYRILHFNIIV